MKDSLEHRKDQDSQNKRSVGEVETLDQILGFEELKNQMTWLGQIYNILLFVGPGPEPETRPLTIQKLQINQKLKIIKKKQISKNPSWT